MVSVICNSQLSLDTNVFIVKSIVILVRSIRLSVGIALRDAMAENK